MQKTNNLPHKRHFWSLLLIIVIMLTLGLTLSEAPRATAACPIEGCNPPPPHEPSLPLPPSRDILFYVQDQDAYIFHIDWLTVSYYTVSNGTYVKKTRTAYPTSAAPYQVSGDFFQNISNYGLFRSVRLATGKPTTFTAYGHYNNGYHTYKSATIQGVTTDVINDYCHKWVIYSDNSTIMTRGFYPVDNCS